MVTTVVSLELLLAVTAPVYKLGFKNVDSHRAVVRNCLAHALRMECRSIAAREVQVDRMAVGASIGNRGNHGSGIALAAKKCVRSRIFAPVKTLMANK
jgi:hypothetical protein